MHCALSPVQNGCLKGGVVGPIRLSVRTTLTLDEPPAGATSYKWKIDGGNGAITFQFQSSRASLQDSLRLSRFNLLTRKTKRLRLFQLSIREKWTEMFRNLSLFLVLLACVAAQSAMGQDRSLTAQIRVDQAQIKENEPFAVATSIRNTGATEKVLQIWACAFPSEWLSDNERVHLHQVNCTQDSKTEIKLKPGEAFKRSLPVFVQLPSDRTGPEPLTFRLGFGNSFHFGDQKPVRRDRAIWSNAVTVTVLR